jgi:chromosome segregation ATPase
VSQRKDQLDLAGQAILNLLDKAAGAAEANTRRAVETVQELSGQLRAAENRIAELEAENQLYRDRLERAEEWLRRIYSEIQGRFIREP